MLLVDPSLPGQIGLRSRRGRFQVGLGEQFFPALHAWAAAGSFRFFYQRVEIFDANVSNEVFSRLRVGKLS